MVPFVFVVVDKVGVFVGVGIGIAVASGNDDGLLVMNGDCFPVVVDVVGVGIAVVVDVDVDIGVGGGGVVGGRRMSISFACVALST
jgi:hypothetical protein